MVRANKFLILLIVLLAVVILYFGFSSATGNCWQYTTQSTCETNSCKWKSDSWGSWCEEFQCWSLNTQTDCQNSTYSSLIGKNCTWQSGGTSTYCGQVSCWLYSGINQSYCETNPSGRSCQFLGECYSLGGGVANCWNITNENTCVNTTGCDWGRCEDKGCWAYNSTTCSAAKDPWSGRNCTWSTSSSSCTEASCGNTALYPNQTVCDTVSHCRWQGSSTSGWCETKNCWNFDGNQTGCNTANTTIGKACTWSNGYCNEDGCWNYDSNQTGCNQKPGCSWQTSTSSGWCEQVSCWTWDSMRGGNQTQCQNNDAGYGLTCLWSGNPSGNATNGWCYQDSSGTSCANITIERDCYDTNYCWWQANNWSNPSAGGNCTTPNWGSVGYSNSSIVNNWNPGCYIFDLNSTECNYVSGCYNTSGDCEVNATHANVDQINTNGINCTMINNSNLCNDIPILSSCCSWQNGSCSTSQTTTSCRDQMSQTPNGETSCEDATTQGICNQLTNNPWYWPCNWNNATSKCGVNTGNVWGNRTQNFVTIENEITCEAVGGKWVTDNYCEGSVSVPAGRCEYKFDEERNCNKACFACEYQSDGSTHNSSEDARLSCLNSNLGYCEFDGNSNAPNSYGYCKAKEQFREGTAEECSSSNCGGCTFMGFVSGANGTKTPVDYCNDFSSSCKWIFDNSSSTKGYCVDKGTKVCEDSCDRCYIRDKCVNDGRINVANQSGSCKWQGTDDDGSCVSNVGEDVEICWNGEDDNDNNLMDCADPGCYGDSFCGFVGGTCSVWTDQTTCQSNSCEWVTDKWGSWCDFKGTQCWKYDKNQNACQGITQVNNETLNISSARLAGNEINISKTFILNNLGIGWVLNSVSITNTTGTSLTGNFAVNYTTQTITFSNNTFMISGGGQGNITNVTYQYYTNTSQYCEWQNGSGTGWCEQDWSVAEQCMGINNQTTCRNTQVSGTNCTWTTDTWCQGQGNSSDWCQNNGGGWCDHPDFKPKDCWQYIGQSSCNTANCSWRADEWGQSHCEVNWSNNCWNYTSSGACGVVSGCAWRSDSWGGWCDNAMNQCWNSTNMNSQTNCAATTGCSWRNTSWGGECQPACFNSTLSVDSAACGGVSGCYWKADSGWCEEKQSAQCWNSTLSSNEIACAATTGCRWKNPGWCSPEDGFNAGSVAGGGGIGGATGSECYKYDSNQSACTNSSLIGTSCVWTVEPQPVCEVDWSRDCWQYASEGSGCNATNGCWWNSNANPGYCTNIMDQCWQNQTLTSNATACNANTLCSASSFGCEPKCFSTTTQLACGAINASGVSACKWITGLCDSAGMSEIFDGMEKGQPTPLGMDVCDGIETSQASVDLCGFGMKDMGDAYGFGAFVRDFTNSSACNKIKVRQGGALPGIPGIEVIGSGNETTKYLVYIDSDGSTSGSCNLDSNNSASGYEFKLVYSSEWNSNTSKATETFTSYKCDNNNWKISDIKISAWKDLMCKEIGGPMIAIDKSELSKYPTLYDSTKDLRVYVATAGNTGNSSSPSDTAGPGWATPGAIDFEIMGAFEYGADSAKFEDLLKKGFVQYEDCFAAGDEDNDGNINCNDWNCQFAPMCSGQGVNAANYSDTKMPQVVGAKIEEYPDSALIIYDTNKPANGTLEFYKNDSECLTLNTSVYDIGITSANVRDYKLWHTAEIYSGNLGYSLTNDTTYYYKLKICDSNGKCGISRCSSFITSSQTKCGFCNFVTRIKTASSWTASYDDNQDGTYEHTQGQVCGSNAGMKTNYSSGRRVNIKLTKSDGSTYFEFLNASLTKTGLNDKVRAISDSGDIISSSSLVGLTSETRDKIINNLHPEICRIKIPTTGGCTTLYHCDDSGNNCTDRTSEATLLDSANCVWQIPYCEFSTYKTTGSSGTPASSGGGGGGGASIGGATYTVTSEQFNLGYTKQLAVKDKLKFNVSNASHLLELTGITTTTATIKISSTPQEATLPKGETKKFEVTGDNFYDLAVTINNIIITNNTATKSDITIKANSDEISSTGGAGEQITGGAVAPPPSGTPGAPKEEGKNLLWLWLLIAIAIVAAAGLVIYKMKKR